MFDYDCLAYHLRKLHPAYKSNISVLILKTTQCTDSYENTVSSQAVFFFSHLTFWIFIKNIYYQYI